MVVSKINKSINYPEIKTIDHEDKGSLSVLYELELELPEGTIEIIVVLGKPKYTYNAKKVIYFPIYVVSKNAESRIRIKSQIGIFEIEASRVLSIYDEDKDVDLTKLDTPLLYSFVNKRYLEKAKSNPSLFKEIIVPPSLEKPEPELEQEEPESDSDDILHLKVKQSRLSASKQDIKEILINWNLPC
jgi:hypothetical protein